MSTCLLPLLCEADISKLAKSNGPGIGRPTTRWIDTTRVPLENTHVYICSWVLSVETTPNAHALHKYQIAFEMAPLKNSWRVPHGVVRPVVSYPIHAMQVWTSATQLCTPFTPFYECIFTSTTPNWQACASTKWVQTLCGMQQTTCECAHVAEYSWRVQAQVQWRKLPEVRWQ